MRSSTSSHKWLMVCPRDALVLFSLRLITAFASRDKGLFSQALFYRSVFWQTSDTLDLSQ